jgi:hypothetical protein
MGLLQLLFGPPAPIAKATDPVHLAPGAGFDFDIVGEASYQDALDDLCGGKCDEGHNLGAVAQLCFQEDNPYDANAVVVLIDRRVVGYIPREKAPWFRSEILRINPDERPVICDARIVGGWNRGSGDEGNYGVKLSITEPLQSTG